MLTIPPPFREILAGDPAHERAALGALQRFSAFFRASERPFFRDYTEHGAEHVNRVMESASWLIPKASRALVSAADVSLLTHAILLHDAALYLSEEGFRALVTSGDAPPFARAFGDRPWPQLWREYVIESRRWPVSRREAVLGSPEPPRTPPVETPEALTGADRRLVGEFIRQHHTRMAHEIAVGGHFGAEERIPLVELLPREANLAGLIARSHGMDLRATFGHLDHLASGIREYRGSHPVYLMVLLRLADFLHVEAERAPSMAQQVRRIVSPLSRLEHAMHHAIEDVRHTHDDPESIEVVAQPQDVHTFLRTRELLQSLQDEFDACWAVLGEVFGRTGFRALGLKLRRVRSNLDDEARFAETVSYVPRRAQFRASGAELLALLVRPLYGDRPDYGIRELVQNAVDAVLTRRWYERDRPSPTDGPDVSVSLEEAAGRWTVVVRDRGIGMTTDTVCNQFLAVGARFRDSDEWKRSFEDEHGRSRVVRSGRFGVGLLAAFLLGDEIDVRTRHVSLPEEEGLSFRASLSGDAVELRRTPLPVGTTISVGVSSSVAERLLLAEGPGTGKRLYWDWYCASDPRVERHGPGGELLADRHWVPGVEESPPAGWVRLPVPGYKHVDWTFETGTAKTRVPGVACNGIRVRATPANWSPELTALSPFTFPRLSVWDPDANLPLRIERDDLLTGSVPFEDELLDDITLNLIAYLVTVAPMAPLNAGAPIRAYTRIDYPGFSAPPARTRMLSSWVSRGDGAVPALAEVLRRLDARHAYVIPVRPGTLSLPRFETEPDTLVGVYVLDPGNTSIREFLEDFTDPFSVRRPPFPGYSAASFRLATYADYQRDYLGARRLAELMENRGECTQRTGWDVWRTRGLPEHDPEFEAVLDAFAAAHPDTRPDAVMRYDLVGGSPSASFVEQRWCELLGAATLAYDPGARGAACARHPRLAEHLEEWRRIYDLPLL